MTTEEQRTAIVDGLLLHLDKRRPRLLREEYIGIALALLARLAAEKGWSPTQTGTYAGGWVREELRKLPRR